MSERMWIAMSGGVDSSIAAALMAEQGHDCTGVTMTLGRGAADEAAVADARAVCEHLGIPHRVVDLSAEFRRSVVEATAEAYAAGRTPNPCVLCNAAVKFGILLQSAREAGARLATGHYARIVAVPGGLRLARALDASKDQTYFLYRLGPEDLEYVIFPLGQLTKTTVRAMAAARGLAEKHGRESQDACFLDAGGYAALVSASHPEACQPGPIYSTGGAVLGTHAGLCRYTVGQRRGIGIASAEPLYVVGLDAARNAIIVGGRRDLEVTRVVASDAVWFAAGVPLRAEVMVRYNAVPVPAAVRRNGDTLIVVADEPLVGVAPGQALVCYNGEVVIGGGTIEEAT